MTGGQYLGEMQRGGWVYILANKPFGTLYTGVTSDLIGRIAKHRDHHHAGSFTARYGLYLLVYHEWCPTIVEAIAREKQLKAGSRKRKVDLITGMNPKWSDLYDQFVKEAEGR